MKIWIDKQTGTWGANPEDIVLAEIPGSLLPVLDNMSDSEIIDLAEEVAANIEGCTFLLP